MKLYLLAILATISLMVSSCKKADSSGGGGNPQQSSDGSSQQQQAVGPPEVPAAQTNSNGPNPENPPGQPTVSIEEKRLPVKRIGREGYMSCWAASGEMLMHFIGSREVRQCLQAKELFGFSVASDCCGANGMLRMGSSCDGDGYPDFERWGFDFAGSSTPLSWDDAVKEIKANRPFGFAWIADGTEVAHMMVVSGYKTDGTDKRLLVVDPIGFPGPAIEDEIFYSDYEGSSGYRNVTNFYKIKVRSTPP